MGDEEEYEGKDIAIQMKRVKEFEEKIQEWINNGKQEGVTVLDSKNYPIQMDIRKDDKGYKFTCFSIEILSIDNKEEITYNKSGLEELKRLIDEGKVIKYEELGLPEPEDVALLEQMRNGEKREEEKSEKDLSDKIKEDENEEEQDVEEEALEDIAKEEGTSVDAIKNKTLELSDIRTIDGIETIKQKIPGASKYKSIIAIPKEGMVTGFEYRGVLDDGKIEKLELNEERYGTNPNEEITILGGERIETVMLTDIHEMEGEEGRIGTYMRSIWNSRSSIF